MQDTYQPQALELLTQTWWNENKVFHAKENVNAIKFYCLSMFPYPSGKLHMGHVRVYTIGDVIARYQRMLGKEVLQPMGWDAFGLPAENAAIKHGVAPSKWTYDNISIMRNQMTRLGFGYDWERELITCDPSYYRWEQWLFLRLYKKGLVYRKNAEVNWDPVDQTILANEQVVDGRGWRSGALVERKEIPQWFFKITAYAEELLTELDALDGWPQQVRTIQKNWIGKSTGLEIHFSVPNETDITIFTTRPDTLFGATFLAIAPTHPLAKKAARHSKDIEAFLDQCRNIKVAESEIATIEKKGICLPTHALHPLTGQPVPIWIANFVVMDYGTGALMGVPAHDQRDFEFARQYQLPILPVIQPHDKKDWDFQANAYTGKGTLIASGPYSGLTSEMAFTQIAADLGEKATIKTNYRLRDWSISRQRYWGTPIPMVHCERCGIVPVDENDLPVRLPENITFTDVHSPLHSMPEFYQTTCPNCHEHARRDTETFDTFVESSWYYARYACKQQEDFMLDGRVNYWLPVDQYVGGIEHAVMHLLYARFFHKVMRDEGLVNSDEPFTRLLTQGFVLNQGAKMSKSKGNVVDPQELIDRYGADTVRLFIIFAAPPEQSLEWSDSGVQGAHRFLNRLWLFAYRHRFVIIQQNRLTSINQFNFILYESSLPPEQIALFRQMYLILDQAKFDYERQQFNTVVSACMKLFNLLNEVEHLTPSNTENDTSGLILQKGMSIVLRLLAPITPHIAHVLWEELGFDGHVLDAPLPKSNAMLLKTPKTEWVVQINGKLRTKILFPSDATNEFIETETLKHERVALYTQDKKIKKIILVHGKLINIVTEV